MGEWIIGRWNKEYEWVWVSEFPFSSPSYILGNVQKFDWKFEDVKPRDWTDYVWIHINLFPSQIKVFLESNSEDSDLEALSVCRRKLWKRMKQGLWEMKFWSPTQSITPQLILFKVHYGKQRLLKYWCFCMSHPSFFPFFMWDISHSHYLFS